MKVLIVENDSNKSSEVLTFLQNELSLSEEDLEIKRSYQSGLESILLNSYDLLILDMSLPTFDITGFDDGGETLDRGGEIILQEMERENVDIKAVILTQYEAFGGVSLTEIEEALLNDFPSFFLGCIYYNTSENNWKTELKTIIQNQNL